MTPDYLRFAMPILMPLAVGWVEEQERRILYEGQPLEAWAMRSASKIGIANQERVRVLVVDEIPWPQSSLLRRAGRVIGLVSEHTAAISVRYGIYLRAEFAEDRGTLVHELVHTRQYERLGGIRPFLEKYLAECLESGYESAPMEQEARQIALELCGPEVR